MTIRVAIVADDLTGALDTSAPFVAFGLSASIAVTHDGLDAALGTGAPVVAVNTGSRGIPVEEARLRASAVARLLREAAPEVLVKKIDSRLKGHIAAETRVVADVFGLSRIVIAPAVPDQGRLARGGRIVGAGIEMPIPIAPRFELPGLAVDIVDAVSDADLDVVAGRDGPVLFVGARGLGAALARRLGGAGSAGSRQLPRSRATLFVIGSRDRITEAQVDHLVAASSDVLEVLAPDGMLSGTIEPRFPMVIRCTGDGATDPRLVADRFAAGVRGLLAAAEPENLVMSGGETAQSLLSALGIAVLNPLGETCSGLPWFEIPGRLGGIVRCVAKSGGFGRRPVLAELMD